MPLSDEILTRDEAQAALVLKMIELAHVTAERDAVRAELARVVVERDNAQAALATHKARADKLAAEDTARAEAARSARIKALREYAAHAHDCVASSVQVGALMLCSCGLDKFAIDHGVQPAQLVHAARIVEHVRKLSAPRRLEVYT